MQKIENDLIVDIKDLAFQWKAKSIFTLSVPSFEVKNGKTIFLYGASGSGKSTLLSLITGMNSPQAGNIWIDNQNITQLTSRAKDRFRANKLGIIFQQLNLIPFTTPYSNIELALAFADHNQCPKAEWKNHILEITDNLDLEPSLVLKARASELSIGQQQRVAVARALINKPKLIIADEPTSALDENSQSLFLDLLFSQVNKIKASLIMVSHDKRLSSKFDESIDLHDICQTVRQAS